MDENDRFDEERSFFQRHPVAIGLVIVVFAGVLVMTAIAQLNKQNPPSRTQQLSIVQLLPPPAPPTPPPAQQATPPPMVEQQKMIEPESKPKELVRKDEPPKPRTEAPAGPLGMNAKGEGAADQFGLVGRSGGNGLVGGGGGGRGSRWGWYATQVQATIEEALRNNAHTRNAKMNLQVRIWPDKVGRIMRAQLTGSTGDSAVDNAIANEVLSGLQLQEPPPADMPTPIVLRLVGRRPS
jgi:periplasmic protein TonB